jgi:hypothetical protein
MRLSVSSWRRWMPQDIRSAPGSLWTMPVSLAALSSASFLSPGPYITTGQMTQAGSQTYAQSAPTPGFDERLIDARLEAVEARTETKFAQLLGKLDLLGSQLTGIKGSVEALDGRITTLDGRITTIDDHVRSARSTIIAFVVATGLAVAGLAWAGVQIFQSGMGVSASAFQAGLATNTEPKK